MVIVHLVEFRSAPGHEAEVVACLRHPEVRIGPPPQGLLADTIGRRLGQRHREHVLVTAWKDEPSWRKGTDNGSPRCLAQVAEWLTARRDCRFRAVACAGPSWQGSKILRVYRGKVPRDSLASWEARANGPMEGLAAKPGLVSIAVGPVTDDATADDATAAEQEVVAVSSWRDWDSVLQATGGHLDRLIEETEMSELERKVDVEHYQLLNGNSSDQAAD